MSHLDDQQFALLALEGQHVLTPEAAAHLDACEQCRTEVSAYLAVGDALRERVTLERPSEDVWARISAELDSEPVDLAARRSTRPASATTTPAPIPDPEPSVPAGGAGGTVTELPRSNPWIRRIAFAAAASFALGAASTVVLGQLLSRPSTEVIQAVGLDPLPGWDAEGSATLQQSNGDTVLVIDLPEAEMDGFREVWLIDRNVERLVSLGTMTGDRAEFTIPEGLDLDEYVIVDVSREHFDGDPTHSGDSIVRGQLS